MNDPYGFWNSGLLFPPGLFGEFGPLDECVTCPNGCKDDTSCAASGCETLICQSASCQSCNNSCEICSQKG
jgi:hypothetical protein